MSETRFPLPSPRSVAQAPAPDASKAMTLFVMIVATLYFGKEVLVPVTLALLLAFVLAPLVTLLRQLRLGKIPSALLDVMLGDRPALIPVESFYQRILAGDADEAQDHAELLLKERSLSTYYDEVALKGLQLAANDAQRGVLDHEQLDRIKSIIKTLVNSLAAYDDRQPPASNADNSAVAPPDGEKELSRNPEPEGVRPEVELPPAWRGASGVLCIAGRGPLDEAASAMLAQLVGKHGMGARMVGYGEASREEIETLDVEGVAMACVSYLDISGSPAHLRYLMRRRRQL